MKDILAYILADKETLVGVSERYNKYVNVHGSDDCWPWTGCVNSSGYGRLKVVSYRIQEAHRIAWALHTGVSPGEMMVCHHCDNPPCCNPKHLFLGTHAENMADMASKGRAKPPYQKFLGENNGSAKISEKDASKIIEMISNGWRNTEISERFNISHSMVSCIRLKKSWTHLPRPRDFKKYDSLRRTRTNIVR